MPGRAKLRGLDRYEARKRVVADITAERLAVTMASEMGLRLAAGVPARLVEAAGEHREEEGGHRSDEPVDPHAAQGVGVHDIEPLPGPRRHRLDRRGQLAGEDRVDLDGDDVPGLLEDREGERAEPRTDLDDRVGLADLCGADDPSDGVRVDDEVLPPLLRRADAEPGGDLPEVGRAEEPGTLVGGCRAPRVLLVRHGRKGAITRRGRSPTGAGPPWRSSGLPR